MICIWKQGTLHAGERARHNGEDEHKRLCPDKDPRHARVPASQEYVRFFKRRAQWAREQYLTPGHGERSYSAYWHRAADTVRNNL